MRLTLNSTTPHSLHLLIETAHINLLSCFKKVHETIKNVFNEQAILYMILV